MLAAATFSSIRASKRSTDLAERSLLAGLRPLLVPSREDDAPERVRFGDSKFVVVPGHGGVLEYDRDNLYMAIALRNGGAGIAVIHGWAVTVQAELSAVNERPKPEEFRRQLRDLYIPAGDTGFWQGAIRDRGDPDYEKLVDAARSRTRVMIDLLYGDTDGGQRTVTRFGVSSETEGEGSQTEVLRVWNIDGVDPRRE